MPKYITSTNVSTLASVKGINPDTEEITERSKTIFGEPSNTEILVAFHSAAFMPMKVVSATVKTEKRRMPFERFIMNSVQLSDENRKDKGRFILRTVKHTKALLKVVNIVTDEVLGSVYTFDGQLDEAEILTEARLHNKYEECPYKVVSFETTEEKRRISFEKWMELSEACGDETADSE